MEKEEQFDNVPCLVPFNIWKELDVSQFDSINFLNKNLEQIQAEISDKLFDSNAQVQCDHQNGVFYKDTCHFYEVLRRLCVKISFEYDEDQRPTKVEYDAGCFAGDEPSLLQKIEVGKSYDLSKEVSVEVRSSQDPYMVFAYTRDSLGTDFTIFLLLAVACSIAAVVSILILTYQLCCFLEKRDKDDIYHNPNLGNETGPGIRDPHSFGNRYDDN